MIFPLNTPFMDSFPMFSPFNPSFSNIFGWFSHRKTGFRLVWTLTAQVVLGPNYDPRVTGEPENGLPVKFSRWAKGSRCNEVCGTVVCMCVHNYTHIYIYMVPCPVFPPPQSDGSAGSTTFPSIWKLLAAFLRSSLVFARSLQHFWLPAAHTYLPTYLTT